MAVRISDVARRAGVSNATVSRVLANHPHVREALRARVLAAAEALGYQPSRLARSLRTKRSRILGLVISDIQNPFFTALSRAVEDIAYANDHAVFLCNTDEDPDKERFYLELMRAERVAGVVLTPTLETGNPCRALVEAGIPVVAVDRRIRDLAVDTVVVDNVGAACEAVCHLAASGYQRVGAVLPQTSITTGRERFEGYLRALKARGLPFRDAWCRSGPPAESVGYRLTRELLELPEPPDALFLGNNLLTLGALRALRDLGLHVPGDLGLVAFDDVAWVSLFGPDLSAVAQPTYALGQTAARLLLERLENPDRPPQEVVLHPTLHIRRSSAASPARARVSVAGERG